MDLKESQYDEIGENVYDKIETELPLENRNTYEQLGTDISLNEIGFVINDKGKDNADVSQLYLIWCFTSDLNLNRKQLCICTLFVFIT